MRHAITHTLAAAAAALATAPAPAQTMLDKLLQKVVKPNGTAGARSVAGNTSASITPAQSVTIDRLLAGPVQDARVAADRTAAGPLIKMVLSTASCARRDSAWNALNRLRLEPTTLSPDLGTVSPMSGMKYHDQNVCLDLARLTTWTKPADNALSFTAYYLAGDSGEAANQTYQLQKSTDGQWLIRSIAYSYS